MKRLLFQRSDLSTIFLLLFFVLTFLVALLNFSIHISVGIILALGVLISVFIKIEVGLLLLIVSMLFSPEITIGFIPLRPITIRLEDLLLILIFLAWIGRLSIKREYKLLVKTPLNLPIFLFILINIIATIRGILIGSVSLYTSLFYNLKLIEFFLIYFLIVNYVKEVRKARFFLTFMIVTCVVVAIYGMFQIPKVEIFTLNRITAPFEGSPEPTTLGGYFILLLAIIIALLLYAPSQEAKFGWASLSMVIVLPFLYTLSRTSYLSGMFMLLALGLISKKKWFLFLFVFLLILSPLYLPEKVIERIAYTFEGAKSSFVDPSTLERIGVWRKALYTLKTSPFLGYGVTAGNILDCQYVKTIFESGLLGLSIFLWIIVRIFKCAFSLFKKVEKGWVKGFALGYLAGFVGILIHSFATITFYIVRIMEPFWFLTALIVILYKINVEEQPV